MTADLIPEIGEAVGRYIQVNAEFWDEHRKGGSLLTIGTIIALVGFLFSLSLLTFFKFINEEIYKKKNFITQ